MPMECHSSESKKLLKVFEAAKRIKSARKKGRHCLDESNSMASDGSTSITNLPTIDRPLSTEASFENVGKIKKHINCDGCNAREEKFEMKCSSPPPGCRKHVKSPRRQRRNVRELTSLALKAGLTSTPRTESRHGEMEVPLPDQDSFVYAFLEEAIKQDKRKQRRSEQKAQEALENEQIIHASEHHGVHRHHRGTSHEAGPAVDQSLILETFAKLCSQLSGKKSECKISRSRSNKSLQHEFEGKRDPSDLEQRHRSSREHSIENVAVKTRSQDTLHRRSHSRDMLYENDKKNLERSIRYKKENEKYYNRTDVRASYQNDEAIRYRNFEQDITPTRSRIDARDANYERKSQYQMYEGRSNNKAERCYESRRCFEGKASRSFDVPREHYVDEGRYKHTARSDNIKDRRYEDYRYQDNSKYPYYEDRCSRRKSYIVVNRDKRAPRRDSVRERLSEVSRDDDYRERCSANSIGDEESLASARSDYLKAVKQEISEQREAMDKMMKLWKELMRCFKSVSSTQGQSDKHLRDSAATAKASAAEQLKLWRECMQRYETVARDVGDTDARLMQEINKQRNEMAEMATMWQECLQRYRDMSNDFDKLKQQVKTKSSPIPSATCARGMSPPAGICADGEGPAAVPYRVPPNYLPQPQMGSGYMSGNPGAPLRPRGSAPPWWWCGERPPHSPRSPPSPRRRSSPDSRTSRDRDRDDRDRRHRHKERDENKHKEKPKPSGSRSEHKHRRR